jgi:hypothetical protein
VKIEGMFKHRAYMIVACLGANKLVRNTSSNPAYWCERKSESDDDRPVSWADTRCIYWGTREELLVGSIYNEEMLVVTITPAGEDLAARLLPAMVGCPECGGESLELCTGDDMAQLAIGFSLPREDAAEIVGIGCSGCEGMFDPKVVARAWMVSEEARRAEKARSLAAIAEREYRKHNHNAGIIQVTFNGEVYRSRGDFTYSMGRPRREAIVGEDSIHGYREAPQTTAFIEGELLRDGREWDDFDLARLAEVVRADVSLELASGKFVVLHDACLASATTTDGDTTTVRFEGSA